MFVHLPEVSPEMGTDGRTNAKVLLLKVDINSWMMANNGTTKQLLGFVEELTRRFTEVRCVCWSEWGEWGCERLWWTDLNCYPYLLIRDDSPSNGHLHLLTRKDNVCFILPLYKTIRASSYIWILITEELRDYFTRRKRSLSFCYRKKKIPNVFILLF